MSISLDLDHHSHVDRPRSGRTSLVGLMKPELRDVLKGIGLDDREAKMRASQLWNWIYHNGVTDFDKMSNIQKGFRQKLDDTFLLDRPEIVTEQISIDGTRKWLFRFRDPKNPLLPPVEVETVYIPEEDRGRVTERFVRLDSSRTKPGNGLGLSLVSGVMKLHKGALLLEDNTPGLKATLVLPVWHA